MSNRRPARPAAPSAISTPMLAGHARTTVKPARRATSPRHEKTTFENARPWIFAGIVVVVMAVGAYLAFGNFLTRPTTAAGAINVQSSMAGFTPSEIHVKAGSTVSLDWWTEDAAMHLSGGVHTMIAPDLGLREELPAESRRTVTWAVPNKPGTYDVYCDSCCGGKDNPVMHGKIVVEPSA